jgi:formylglycine-generating enzyme required for sulfatase activity
LYPEGATPIGIQDLAGNCWEWVGDWWRDRYDKKDVNHTGRVFRGGASSNTSQWLRVSFRYQITPDARAHLLGFRCVRDLPA